MRGQAPLWSGDYWYVDEVSKPGLEREEMRLVMQLNHFPSLLEILAAQKHCLPLALHQPCSSMAPLTPRNGQKLPLLWGEQRCTGEQPGLAVGLCLGQLGADIARGKDSGCWGGRKQQQYSPGHEGTGEHPAPPAPLLGIEASKVGL